MSDYSEQIRPDGYHASETGKYGLGSDKRYGHVKIKEEHGLHVNNGTISVSIVDENNDGVVTSDMYNKIDYIYNKCKEVFTPEVVSFADCTDTQLTNLLKAHYADFIDLKDIWAVGDEHIWDIAAMTASTTFEREDDESLTVAVGEAHQAQTQPFVIADFDHFELVDKRLKTNAILCIIQKYGLTAYNPNTGAISFESGYMNPSNVSAGGWEACRRRLWCNWTYFNALEEVLKKNIKEVYIQYRPNSGYIPLNCIDKCFIPSISECNTSYSYWWGSEGTAIELLKTAANRYSKTGRIHPEKGLLGGTSGTSTFVRTPSNYSSSYPWSYINTSGAATYTTANNSLPWINIFNL